MLIYDGDCGFCTMCVGWLRSRLRLPIEVVAWQELHDLGELDLTTEDVTTAAYVVDAYGRRFRGHRAVARVLRDCRGAWPLVGIALGLPGVDLVAAAGYQLVARNRGRLPGATAACAVPAPRRFRREPTAAR